MTIDMQAGVRLFFERGVLPAPGIEARHVVCECRVAVRDGQP